MTLTWLDKLAPISLDQMGTAQLMDRVDTKYLARVDCLDELLRMALPEYRVVEIEGLRRLPYATRYFDTPRCDMYHDHQRGKKARKKVRVRIYENETPLAFIEVKDKNNKGQTRKKRRMLAEENDIAPFADFVLTHSGFELSSLIPQIANRFRRITLVRNSLDERITIDTDLQFENLVTGITDSLPHIVIIEWKRSGRNHNSPMRHILKHLGIKPTGFSKYCVGMARTNPALKQNSFKKKIRTIDRIGAC